MRSKLHELRRHLPAAVYASGGGPGTPRSSFNIKPFLAAARSMTSERSEDSVLSSIGSLGSSEEKTE